MRKLAIQSVLLLVSSFCLFGCYAEHKGWVEQSEETSYVRFSGDPTGVEVQIDDQDRFQPKTGGNVYELEPGKKEIRVFKNGELKIHRKIFLSDEDTREIKLP